ncbi:aminotransferase class I/II-fold pyridoxal phosphate-dependent enzyme, partial [Pseudomonas aeruginosa]
LLAVAQGALGHMAHRAIDRPRTELLAWHARLQRRGGWLLVDEAFMDCTPKSSLAACSNRPGLIVLRSFGKFFGLAGARLGFALCER